MTREGKGLVHPVLLQYAHFFHDVDTNYFKGTCVVEHKILTGDVCPIKQPPYRVPCSLRGEMRSQIDKNGDQEGNKGK